MIPQPCYNRKIRYSDEIEIVWNGIVWTVWKKGRNVAFCHTEEEAIEYAKRYSTYKEDETDD